MKKHCRRLSIFVAHNIGVAAMFVALSTQAVTLGHSRVTSLPNKPLRIVVQLKDVTASDSSSLSAQMAPLSAWQEAGLTPPVDLSSLGVQLTPSSQPNTMQLWVQSPQDASANVLDVLVDIKTATATQRHQVSVLQIKKPTPISLASAPSTTAESKDVVTATSTAITSDQKNQLTIKKGQYLYQIARKLRSDQYNDQQLMAALVQANPSVFIQNNMNLMRSGVTLEVPAAESVALITPQQAHQIYQTHLQHFDEYRQRIAKGQPPAALPAIDSVIATQETTKATSEVSTEETTEAAAKKSEPLPEPKTDRLELSSKTDDVSQADQAASTQQELAYTSERLAELESGLTIEPEGLDTDPVNANEVDQKTQDNSLAQPRSNLSNNEQVQTASQDTGTSPRHASWLESNILLIALGLLLLMVILVGWFLRAGHSNQLNKAEIDKPKVRNTN